jgi:flagellar motor protein MotB
MICNLDKGNAFIHAVILAVNVTNILLQKGNVPLTRILAPGAMGDSRQVNSEKSADGQAENRRVVVRVLQYKAIAGI